MVRAPPCFEFNTALKKGAWSPEEDQLLRAYIRRHDIWNWNLIPKAAGLQRSGKSCRLRWMNYLKPGIRHGHVSKEEEETIVRLHEMLGNKWSAISAKLPGRTDNEIKNHWHSHLKKRLKSKQGVRTDHSSAQVETNKSDAKLSNLADSDLPIPSVTETSMLEGSINIPISSLSSTVSYSSAQVDPAVGIDEYMTIEMIMNGSSDTFRDISSFWAPPFSVEDMEDIQATYVDEVFIDPNSQVCIQEPAMQYGANNEVGSDFWNSLLRQADEMQTQPMSLMSLL